MSHYSVRLGSVLRLPHVFCWPVLAVSCRFLISNGPVVDIRIHRYKLHISDPVRCNEGPIRSWALVPAWPPSELFRSDRKRFRNVLWRMIPFRRRWPSVPSYEENFADGQVKSSFSADDLCGAHGAFIRSQQCDMRLMFDSYSSDVLLQEFGSTWTSLWRLYR